MTSLRSFFCAVTHGAHSPLRGHRRQGGAHDVQYGIKRLHSGLLFLTESHDHAAAASESI